MVDHVQTWRGLTAWVALQLISSSTLYIRQDLLIRLGQQVSSMKHQTMTIFCSLIARFIPTYGLVQMIA